MATADIVILAIILLSALMGFARGFLKEVLSLVTWVAAIGLALFFAPQAANHLAEHIEDDLVRRVVAFAGIFLCTLVAGGLLQWSIGRLVETTGLSGTDRLFGLVFGAGRGVLVCLVALIAIQQFVESTEWWQASVLAPELLAFKHVLLEILGKTTEWLSEAGVGV